MRKGRDAQKKDAVFIVCDSHLRRTIVPKRPIRIFSSGGIVEESTHSACKILSGPCESINRSINEVQMNSKKQRTGAQNSSSTKTRLDVKSTKKYMTPSLSITRIRFPSAISRIMRIETVRTTRKTIVSKASHEITHISTQTSTLGGVDHSHTIIGGVSLQ